MMELVLDLPPNLGNSRMHWRTKSRRQRNYLEACDNRRLIGLIPLPAMTLERCRIDAHFALHSPSDWDNLGARLKWAFDWLTTRGYIVDDGPHVIIECPVITQSIDRKKKRLVLTITPL